MSAFVETGEGWVKFHGLTHNEVLTVSAAGSAAIGTKTKKANPPANLVHAALWQFDPTLLTSPDGKRIEVSLDAVCKLVANPPPMVTAHIPETVPQAIPKRAG